MAPSYVKVYVLISGTLWRLLMVLHLFLLLRLALIFFGANLETPVVKAYYRYTDMVVTPFFGIFPNVTVWGGVIDVPTVAAMVGYCFLLIVIDRLLKLFPHSI